MTDFNVNTGRTATKVHSGSRSGFNSLTTDRQHQPGPRNFFFLKTVLERFNRDRIHTKENPRYETLPVKYFKHADKARFFEFQFHIKKNGEQNECALL